MVLVIDSSFFNVCGEGYVRILSFDMGVFRGLDVFRIIVTFSFFFEGEVTGIL